jgi:hypothetical protein
VPPIAIEGHHFVTETQIHPKNIEEIDDEEQFGDNEVFMDLIIRLGVNGNVPRVMPIRIGVR